MLNSALKISYEQLCIALDWQLNFPPIFKTKPIFAQLFTIFQLAMDVSLWGNDL